MRAGNSLNETTQEIGNECIYLHVCRSFGTLGADSLGIPMGDVKLMYPNGVPPDAANRLVAAYGNKSISDVTVPNIFTGDETSLEKEREFLHATVDNAITSLYALSPHEKHNCFVGFGNLLKQVFDMYCVEKVKGKL